MKKPAPKIYHTTNWSPYNQALIKRGNFLIDFLINISRKIDMNVDSTKIEICLNNMDLLNGVNHHMVFNRA